MRPHGTPQQLERRRRRALSLYRRGYGPSRIARLLNTTPRSVGRWLRAARRRGRKALDARPVPGRPTKLTPRQKRDLAARLLRGAVSQGFATDLWTCPRIAQLIARRYGVTYHVDHLPRLLAALGFSCQKPERAAIERDERAIRQWVRIDWPRIKKRPAVQGPSGVHR